MSCVDPSLFFHHKIRHKALIALCFSVALPVSTAWADATNAVPAEQGKIVIERNANQPPEVDAGNDQSVAERSAKGASVTVKLKGKASDIDTPLTYAWKQVDTSGITVKLSNAKILAPTFKTVEVKQDTVLTFRLTVKDKLGASATDDVNVTIKQVNRAPKANAGADQTVNSNNTVTLNGSGTDPDGDALSYAWTQTDSSGVSVSLSSSSVAKPTFTAPVVMQATTLTFKLVVKDGGNLSAADSVNIVVNPPVPAAPTNVKAIAGSGQVALMWDSVTNATGYDVCVAKQSIGEVANCTTYTGGTWLIDKTSPATITSLTNDTAYYFRVVAKNASGDSAGSTEVTATPKASGLTAISAGGDHTCAIVNGGVQCWGANWYGQLGNGTTDDSATPVVAIPAGSGVTAIVLGSDSSCAILNNVAKCWGANDYGQLGDGSTLNRSKPTPIYGITGGITAIAVGNSHGCAVVNGGVQCWGANWYGKLGNGTKTDSRKPVQAIAAGSGATAIAVGAYHSCAVVNGGVQCWGYNSSGQLGDGATTEHTKPIQTIVAGSNVTAISSGNHHTCAMVNSALQCWGGNGNGQLGDGSTSTSYLPIETIPASMGIITGLDAGDTHTCVVINGGVQCAGYNEYGQLGNGGSDYGYDSLFVEAITANSGATTVSAGSSHTCAIVSGAVKCWGNNDYGQLGNGNTESQFTPVAGPTF